MEPHYPNVSVKLTSSSGNAIAIIGAVQRALRQSGVPEERVREFTADATSGDYDHVIRTAMNWVNVN